MKSPVECQNEVEHISAQFGNSLPKNMSFEELEQLTKAHIKEKNEELRKTHIFNHILTLKLLISKGSKKLKDLYYEKTSILPADEKVCSGLSEIRDYLKEKCPALRKSPMDVEITVNSPLTGGKTLCVTGKFKATSKKGQVYSGGCLLIYKEVSGVYVVHRAIWNIKEEGGSSSPTVASPNKLNQMIAVNNPPIVSAELQKLGIQMRTFFEQHQLNLLVQLFDENASVMPPMGLLCTGHAEIRTYIASMKLVYDQRTVLLTKNFTFVITQVETLGIHVLATGLWKLSVSKVGQLDEIEYMRGSFMVLLVAESNKVLKIIWN